MASRSIIALAFFSATSSSAIAFADPAVITPAPTVVKAAAPVDPPLVDVEARIGIGIEAGSSNNLSVVRPTGALIGVRIAYAFNDSPLLWGYVGGIAEVGARSSAGVVGGVRTMGGSGWRLNGGVTAIIDPATLYGVEVGAGKCFRATKNPHMCIDLDATVFVAGDDLPSSRVLTQWQIVLGFPFDAM